MSGCGSSPPPPPPPLSPYLLSACMSSKSIMCNRAVHTHTHTYTLTHTHTHTHTHTFTHTHTLACFSFLDFLVLFLFYCFFGDGFCCSFCFLYSVCSRLSISRVVQSKWEFLAYGFVCSFFFRFVWFGCLEGVVSLSLLFCLCVFTCNVSSQDYAFLHKLDRLVGLVVSR